jgi:hypothetical protein
VSKHKAKMKNIISLCLVIALASCADEDELRGADYILFGHYYGECGGETCVEIFKVTDYILSEDMLDNYPAAGKRYQGVYLPLPDQSNLDEVKTLAADIPAQLLSTQDKVIGMPDAGDWGGIYFQISRGGKTQYWLIDKKEQNIPAYLRPFVAAINEKIALINN